MLYTFPSLKIFRNIFQFGFSTYSVKKNKARLFEQASKVLLPPFRENKSVSYSSSGGKPVKKPNFPHYNRNIFSIRK
jgi:hypothetical protein